MKIILRFRFIALSILISFISVISLLNPGLPPTHDGEFHVLRFEQFFKSINQGTLYPRWAEDFNNGYGVPLFNYVYPLPNYVASVTHLLGFSFIDSLKLNMILATITGSVFIFLWSKKYWGDWGALVASTFYAFSPYHLLDIYVRGSVGEVWSLGLMPGLLWSYLSFYETKKTKFLVLSSIFLSLIIFAHNILALVFFVFFIFYALFLFVNKKEVRELKAFLNLSLVSVFGIGLAAIFWLPALFETKYVRGLQIFDPTQHFPEVYKLIYSSWGYGFSGRGIPDQMSFQVGIANVIVMILCLIIFIFKKRNITVLYFIFLFFIFLFLITPFSKFIWNTLPLVFYVQFPWRLLSVLILISSFLAGFLVSKDIIKNKKLIPLISALLMLVSIGFSINYIKAPFHHKRDDNYYLTRDNFIHGTNSPGNVFNTKNFNASLLPAEKRLESKDVQIKSVSSNVNRERAIVSGEKEGVVEVNIAYFPDWTAKINGSEIDVVETKNGTFEVKVPPGENQLEIVLKSTKLQTVSLIISVLSAFMLFCLFMWDKYIKIKK